MITSPRSNRPPQANSQSDKTNPHTYSNENPQGPRNTKRQEQGLPLYNAYDSNYKKAWWDRREGSLSSGGELWSWWGKKDKWEKK